MLNDLLRIRADQPGPVARPDPFTIGAVHRDGLHGLATKKIAGKPVELHHGPDHLAAACREYVPWTLHQADTIRCPDPDETTLIPGDTVYIVIGQVPLASAGPVEFPLVIARIIQGDTGAITKYAIAFG